MVKNNEWVIPKNIKTPVETVYELKGDEYKVPSFEEFMKVYQADEKVNYDDLEHSNIGDSKGYGPCRGTLCGCSCSSYTCNCSSSSASVKFGKWGGPSVSASGRMGEDDIDPEEKLMEGVTKKLLKMGGRPKMEASGQVSASAFGYKDDVGELKVLSGTAGGEISSRSIKGKLSVDLGNMKAGRVQVRTGIAVDTGLSVEDGLEVKAVGFGFSVGKQTGISTPFGEVKVDTEDCVIQ